MLVPAVAVLALEQRPELVVPEKANYCPACGKCMREPIKLPMILGGIVFPYIRAIGIDDHAIHVEDGTRKGEKKK